MVTDSGRPASRISRGSSTTSVSGRLRVPRSSMWAIRRRTVTRPMRSTLPFAEPL